MKQFSLGQKVSFSLDGVIIGRIRDMETSSIIKEEHQHFDEMITTYKQEVEALIVEIKIYPEIAEPL